MKKALLAIIVFFLFAGSALALTRVSGYFRSSGTYVMPYYRSSPTYYSPTRATSKYSNPYNFKW